MNVTPCQNVVYFASFVKVYNINFSNLIYLAISSERYNYEDP
jgi:hypothetical protein